MEKYLPPVANPRTRPEPDAITSAFARTLGLGNRIALGLSLLALSACSGIAPQGPSPESLINKHIEAAYNGQGLDARPSINMRGRLLIESHDIDAPLTMQVEAPTKRYFKTEVMGEEVVRSCKAGRCWSKEVSSPMQELHGSQLMFSAEMADFYRLENLKRYYRRLESGGLTSFNDQQAYELQLTRNSGFTDKWYFAKDSGLWLGGTWRLPREMGGIEVTQYFENYQRFGDIQLAAEITEVTPEQTSKVIIEEVSFENIPDSHFELGG